MDFLSWNSNCLIDACEKYEAYTESANKTEILIFFEQLKKDFSADDYNMRKVIKNVLGESVDNKSVWICYSSIFPTLCDDTSFLDTCTCENLERLLVLNTPMSKYLFQLKLRRV